MSVRVLWSHTSIFGPILLPDEIRDDDHESLGGLLYGSYSNLILLPDEIRDSDQDFFGGGCRTVVTVT